MTQVFDCAEVFKKKKNLNVITYSDSYPFPPPFRKPCAAEVLFYFDLFLLLLNILIFYFNLLSV